MPYPGRGEVRPSRCFHTTLESVSSGLAVFLINREAPGAYARDAHMYWFSYLKSVRAVVFNTLPLYHRERGIYKSATPLFDLLRLRVLHRSGQANQQKCA